MKKYLEADTDVTELFRRHGLHEFALLDASDTLTEKNSGWSFHVHALRNWLKQLRHASMGYLERNQNVRAEPKMLLDGMSSSFVFLIPYGTGQFIRGQRLDADESPQLPIGLLARVARYARFRDYHRLIHKKLDAALTELAALTATKQSTFNPSESCKSAFQFRVVVDSIPFMDRAHAHLAGLGFFGKNTLLIRPGLGSYFFIASVLCTAPAESFGQFLMRDSALRRTSELGCGDCQKCVEACPTGALLGDYSMDAAKCFAYTSIEHKGVVRESEIGHFKDLFFGCDICQEVCPYNVRTRDGRYWSELRVPISRLGALELLDVATMSRAQYESWFGGLPLTRAKYPGLVRNALYGLYASGDAPGLARAMLHWQNVRATGVGFECPQEIIDVIDQIETLQRRQTN
jgi:epoxyqueuosine reductase